MKIEIGESLCYSYLRHVKGCWLVQTNWKSSEHWDKRKTDAELETMFREMRLRFDMGGSVFKQTSSVGQFMQQAEIDVVGIDQDGGVHAMDVAFHENGLNYGGGAANRVLKKMLRAYLLLAAYHPPETTLHIYFVSPRVHKAVRSPLENTIAALQEQYPDANWHLLINESCHEQVVQQTLDRAGSVADTAELFVRASKLLSMSAATHVGSHTNPVMRSGPTISATDPPRREAQGNTLQNLVQDLMKTLLDECPTLLDYDDIRGLMDNVHCKNVLSLKIGNYALLREREHGYQINGYNRYWKDVYGNRFYVCSQWGKPNHQYNANSLLNFLDRLERNRPNHADIANLDAHRSRLRDLVVNG